MFPFLVERDSLSIHGVCFCFSFLDFCLWLHFDCFETRLKYDKHSLLTLITHLCIICELDCIAIYKVAIITKSSK